MVSGYDLLSAVNGEAFRRKMQPPTKPGSARKKDFYERKFKE
ncbi:hypothetical protein [Thermococcus sp.]|nr:hypothetical protein [Thermococcus sp.]